MDQQFQSFEHEALEADIQKLAEVVRREAERPEGKEMKGDELIREALRALPQTAPAQNAQAQQSAAKTSLPDYAQSASSAVKLEIEYLLDVAFHQGVMKADAEARKSTPFVLDAFHDALAGKLYPEFQKRGLLK